MHTWQGKKKDEMHRNDSVSRGLESYGLTAYPHAVDFKQEPFESGVYAIVSHARARVGLCHRLLS